MKTVDKAFAYITHGHGTAMRLLVFRHSDFPEAGVQVPAGTIAADESPAQAVLREAVEETGLCAFSTPRLLGQQLFDARPFGKEEWHKRHFFHLQMQGEVAEQWRHYERDAAGGHAPIAFDFYWRALAQARIELVAEHGALLESLALPQAIRP